MKLRLFTCRCCLVVLAIGLAVGPSAAKSSAQSRSAFRDRAPELQQLVRRLALELDRTKREHPREYEHRYQQLGKAIAAWNDSTRSDSDAEIMTGWLRAALRLALSDAQHSLPPLPQFNERGGATALDPAKPKTNPTRPQPAVPVPDDAPAPPSEKSNATDSRAQQRSAVAKPKAPRKTQRTTRADGLAPIYHSAIELSRPQPHVVRRPPIDDADRSEELDEFEFDEPPPEAIPSHQRAAPAAAAPIAKPPSEARVPTDAAPTTAEPVERLFDDYVPEAASQAEQPPPTTRSSSSVGDRAPRAAATTSKARPQTARVAATDPFRDDPLPASTSRVESRRGAPAESEGPTVNLDELRARIEGYDRGLRKIEAELMGYDALSPATLTRLADGLDDLVSQREFVGLYLGTLSDSELRGLPKLRGAEPAVEMLSQQIIERRHALRRRAGQDDDDRRRDLLLLQEASRRLANLGVNAPPN